MRIKLDSVLKAVCRLFEEDDMLTFSIGRSQLAEPTELSHIEHNALNINPNNTPPSLPVSHRHQQVSMARFGG